MSERIGILEKQALVISQWSEKWFPDSYVFALLGVITMAVTAWLIGASAQSIVIAFCDGFWSLVPFTLQMTMLIVCGYEALPNFINPFFMLPMLGILKLKAKDMIGFTVIQLIAHLPVVLFLLWILGKILEYKPPVL